MTEELTMDGYKVCSKCKEKKPLSDFYVRRTAKDGYNNYCKECCKKYQKEKWAEKKRRIKTRVCPRCGKEKPLNKFGKDASRADGLQSCCKQCAREKTRLCRKRKATEGSSDLQKKGLYEKNKAAILASSLSSYYTTDYLEKKYLKRYRASLEKVMLKRDDLLRKKEEQGALLRYQQEKLDGYLSAVDRWKEKIAEMEELIATYESDKIKEELPPEEKQEQEPTIINDMEEQKPTSAPMTKEALINLLSDVPNDARIIYVGDSENRSSLVAAWRSDPHSVCIRSLNAAMPYIITDGALYELVSASIPFPECPKKGEAV